MSYVTKVEQEFLGANPSQELMDTDGAMLSQELLQRYINYVLQHGTTALQLSADGEAVLEPEIAVSNDRRYFHMSYSRLTDIQGKSKGKPMKVVYAERRIATFIWDGENVSFYV